jgi:hypothetical protein
MRKPRAQVLMIDAHLPSHKVDRSVGLRFKRRKIWRNSRRNIAIAWVATQFIDGKRSWLRRVAKAIGDKHLANLRVVIVVESTEHAKRLQRLLPEWTMLSYYSKDLRPGAAPTKLIITLMRALRGDIETDVVIRATGGRDLLFIGNVDALALFDSRGPAILVDWTDSFDPQCQLDSEARRWGYYRRSWRICDSRGYRRRRRTEVFELTAQEIKSVNSLHKAFTEQGNARRVEDRPGPAQLQGDIPVPPRLMGGEGTIRDNPRQAKGKAVIVKPAQRKAANRVDNQKGTTATSHKHKKAAQAHPGNGSGDSKSKGGRGSAPPADSPGTEGGAAGSRRELRSTPEKLPRAGRRPARHS